MKTNKCDLFNDVAPAAKEDGPRNTATITFNLDRELHRRAFERAKDALKNLGFQPKTDLERIQESYSSGQQTCVIPKVAKEDGIPEEPTMDDRFELVLAKLHGAQHGNILSPDDLTVSNCEPRKETWWEKDHREGMGSLHELCHEMKWGIPGDDIFKIVVAGVRALKAEFKEFREEAYETTKLCHKYQDQLWAADKSVASLQEPEGELPPFDEACEAIRAYAVTLESGAQYTIMSFKAEKECRERQLLASLSELRKLRSQESK